MTDPVALRRLAAALITPVGRGAVATIRVCGDLQGLDRANSSFHAANGRPLADQPPGRIAFGRWGGDDEAEEVVVCHVGRDVLEIYCHGGDAAVRRILVDLERAGCPTEDWFAQVARVVGPVDADCAEALGRATTWRAAEILHEQAGGLLRQTIEGLLQPPADPATADQMLAELDELLSWSTFGIHLTQPWRVVLTGRPNVGKSSLINALLGYQRAIVFDQPGTTRDVVTGETAIDGWPVQLADTAGLRDAAEDLEAAGIALARRQLETADARLVLVDLSSPPNSQDEALIRQWPGAIVVGHKCDLFDQWQDRLPPGAIRASSITGQGLDEIQRVLVARLIPRVPEPGTPVPVSQRQVDLLRSVPWSAAARHRSGSAAEPRSGT